jgi:hypothetical protein
VRPEEVRFVGAAGTTSSEAIPTNRTAFVLRIGAFFVFTGAFAFAREPFEAFPACISFF